MARPLRIAFPGAFYHEYAKELSRYIHLNPVRAKLAEPPDSYEWSSYNFYIGAQFGFGDAAVAQSSSLLRGSDQANDLIWGRNGKNAAEILGLVKHWGQVFILDKINL